MSSPTKWFPLELCDNLSKYYSVAYDARRLEMDVGTVSIMCVGLYMKSSCRGSSNLPFHYRNQHSYCATVLYLHLP